MFKVNPDGMRMEPTPERVLSVCRLVAQKSMTREDIRKAMTLGVNDERELDQINKSINVALEELSVIKAEADNLVLAIPKNLTNLLLNYSNPTEHHINFEDCKCLPFVVVRPNQEMRHLFDKSCNMAGFLPEIAMEVTGISTAWSMCREGIGATLLPRQFVEYMGSADNMTLYTLEQNLRSRQPVIITRKGQYISEHAKYAIKLLTRQIPM